ncbi:MAG: pseudouridine synthase [bacterium]|nr:pseudouridine synthase [bacterium]
MNEITYPIRINRYLYLAGLCSRREADRLIGRGEIYINDKKAVLGQKVNEGDNVQVGDSAADTLLEREYYALHKPKGIVSHNPKEHEQAASELVQTKVQLFPLGRLDKASRGLMILTNDGRITHAVLSPEYEHEKEYIVTVDKRIPDTKLNALERGVTIEGYKTKPAQVKRDSETSFRIILTEGKKHQIRRMCATLGFTVKDILRTRIMHVSLGKLKAGESRKLSSKEVNGLLMVAGLK